MSDKKIKSKRQLASLLGNTFPKDFSEEVWGKLMICNCEKLETEKEALKEKQKKDLEVCAIAINDMDKKHKGSIKKLKGENKKLQTKISHLKNTETNKMAELEKEVMWYKNQIGMQEKAVVKLKETEEWLEGFKNTCKQKAKDVEYWKKEANVEHMKYFELDKEKTNLKIEVKDHKRTLKNILKAMMEIKPNELSTF